MSKRLLIAATYAKPGRAQELIDCYVKEHAPDVRRVPGMGPVTLYRTLPIKLPEGVPLPDAFLVHELEGDPAEVMAELGRRSASGEVRHTDALDGSKSIVFIATPEASF